MLPRLPGIFRDLEPPLATPGLPFSFFKVAGRSRGCRDSQIILVHILLGNVDPRRTFDDVTLNSNVVVSLDPEMVAVFDSLPIKRRKPNFAHRHSGELWIPKTDRLDGTRFEQIAG